MNDGEMTEEEMNEFIRGWRWAQQGWPPLNYECDKFQDGFAFYLQMRAERETPTCH